MRAWLEEALATMLLSEEAQGYMLGRGVSEDRIRDLGVVEWDPQALYSAPPDKVFQENFGDKGRYLHRRLCTPIRCPRGRLLGFEARVWDGSKKLTQFLVPESNWNPVFLGLTPNAMEKVWAGGDVWIVEGLFDLGPMEQVVPRKDVVLSTLRARLSDSHTQFLRRFCSGTVYVAYDNDETGQRQTHGYFEFLCPHKPCKGTATSIVRDRDSKVVSARCNSCMREMSMDPQTGKRRWGALDSLKRVGVRVQPVHYRGGKDPGEIWDGGGLRALKKAFEHYLPTI